MWLGIAGMTWKRDCGLLSRNHGVWMYCGVMRNYRRFEEVDGVVFWLKDGLDAIKVLMKGEVEKTHRA
jgi:hypothetical protein